jgi:mannosyl-oligosaccharide alpha-1,2-mannosidase
MGLNDLFAEAITKVSTVDFTKSKTADLASVFESTIRHVGGALSAYELSDCKYPVLVEKAQQLADQLAFAWVGVSFARFPSVSAL